MKKNKKFENILKIGLSALLGFIGAVVLGTLTALMENRFNLSLFPSSLSFNGGSIIIFYIKLLVCIYLITIIHELGHLIMGILTGYKLISFRVGSLTLKKNEGKYEIKKFNIPGTGGQCLLSPPDLDENQDFNYKLYNLGGILFNLGTFIVCMMVIFLTRTKFSADFYGFGLISLAFALINAIPFSASVNNDGKNQTLLKDKDSRLYFWKSLKIYGNISEGIHYDEMDKFLFEYDENSVESAFKDGIMIINTNIQIENGDYELAKANIEKILAKKDLVGIYRMELNCDLALIGVLNQDKAEVERLLTKDMKKYIKRVSKYYVHIRTLMYGVHKLIYEDLAKAEVELKKFNYMVKRYPNPVEVEMQIRTLEKIDDLYEKSHQTA